MDKEKRALVDQLAGFSTFENCDKGDLAALVSAGGTSALPAGWPFMTQGEPADAIYILLTGEARVFLQRQEIAKLGPGDVIGEMAFFGGGQRSGTVTSSSRVTALRIENDAMHKVVEDHPRVKDALRKVFEAHTAR